MAFEGLTEKLQSAFKKLTGKGKLNEQNIKDAMREENRCVRRSHSNKAQNIIGLVGLLLIFIVLFYIAKFYTIL